MKYIKNKIFIVSLALALCASTVLSVFYFLGVQNLPAAMVQDAMAPFQHFVDVVAAVLGIFTVRLVSDVTCPASLVFT